MNVARFHAILSVTLAILLFAAPVEGTSNPTASKATAANSLLSVTKSGSGTGSVTSNTGLINCGATCSDSYTNGAVVTLAATASDGSQFAGWLGPCTGTGSCVVTVNTAT